MWRKYPSFRTKTARKSHIKLISRDFSWMLRKPAITDDWVLIPVTDDDPYRQMSVMSVLDDMHSSIEGSHESVGSVSFENQENVGNSAEPKLRKNLSQMCRMS